MWDRNGWRKLRIAPDDRARRAELEGRRSLQIAWRRWGTLKGPFARSYLSHCVAREGGRRLPEWRNW